MTEERNKITVRTTGEFELRDPQTNVDITQDAMEVLETSFVTQMIGLKRLEVVKGKVTQEADPKESNQNPSVGEALPVRDNNTTIRELNDEADARTNRRGRPAK
jgi:hypothetical protein